MTSTNHRITDSTPLLGGELAQSVQVGANRVLHIMRGIVQTGPYQGRTCLILRGLHLEGPGWVYSGREIIVPVELAREMAGALLLAAGVEESDATISSPAPGG